MAQAFAKTSAPVALIFGIIGHKFPLYFPAKVATCNPKSYRADELFENLIQKK